VTYSSFLLSGVEEGGGEGRKRSWAGSGRKEYLGDRKAHKDHEESRKKLFMERGLIPSIMKRAEGVIYGESSKEAIYGSKRRLFMEAKGGYLWREDSYCVSSRRGSIAT
jgi:hypothetical protein